MNDMPLAQIVGCPLDRCEWTHLEPSPVVTEGALANLFGPGVMAAVAKTQFHERLERALEQHFATHKPEDYLRTITRLQAALARREGDLL